MHWVEFISRDSSMAMACVGRFWDFVVFIPIGICVGWAFSRVARENMQTTVVQQPDTYAGVLLCGITGEGVIADTSASILLE